MKSRKWHDRLVNFCLDLFRSVCQIDRWRYITSAHLTLCSVQRWDKRWMNESRLRKSQTRRNIPRHPEVRILVDCTRDQTRNVGAAAKYLHHHHNNDIISCASKVAEVWLSRNIDRCINKVALRRAKLVLRWMTICLYTIFVFYIATRANSAWPPLWG